MTLQTEQTNELTENVLEILEELRREELARERLEQSPLNKFLDHMITDAK
jgi:uncharacterized membrane protein